MAVTLSDELMKGKRLEILRYLVNNKDRRFAITEIAESVDASYKTVQVFIDSLEDFGFIESEKHGRTRIVTVNNESPFLEVFERLGEIDSKPFRETAKKFAEEVYTEFEDQIESIILFGSVARGMPGRGSDIDLMILVKDENMVEKVDDKAWRVRDRYLEREGLPINVLTETGEEFKTNLENKSPLETKIKEEGEILKGENSYGV